MTEKRNKMMREPEKITKTAIQTLKKKYGYTDKQIRTDYLIRENIQERYLDIAIFSNDDDKSPKVIGEIKIGDFVFPLAEINLEKAMKISNAKYGFLTNGVEWINYEIVNKKIIRTPTISSKITLQSKIENTDTKQKFTQLTNSSYIIKKIEKQFLENDMSFNEYLQLIFLKIYDEKYEKNTYFKKIIEESELYLEVFQTLWEKSNKKFPELFKENYFPREVLLNHKNLIIEISNYSITKADPVLISKTLLMSFYYQRNTSKENFATPKELSELIDRLQPILNNEKILIPYSGPDRCIHLLQLILSKFSNKFRGKITVIEPDLEKVRFLKIISELRLPKFNIIIGDPIGILNSDKSKEYDHVISIPPMGMKIQKKYDFEQKHDEKSNSLDVKSEMLGNDSINHFFNRLISEFKIGAKFSIIVPQGFLFKQSFSSDSIRRQILDNCRIKAIISLSQRTFSTSGVASALLLLEKGTSNLDTYDIFMAILQKPTIKEYFPKGTGIERNFSENPYLKNIEQVSTLFQEFIKNKSISKPNQSGFTVDIIKIQKEGWTVTDKIPEIKLFDFPDKHEVLECVEIIRGTNIPIKRSSAGEEFNFIKISDFNNDSLNLEKTKKIFLDKNDVSKIKKFLIKKDDILFSCKGTIGKKLLVKNELRNCIASSNLMILRSQSSLIHPEYLQYVLDKELVKDQISALSGGISIPMISLEKFSKIIIPVPSLSKQKEITSKALKAREEISKLEKLLDEAKRKYQEL